MVPEYCLPLLERKFKEATEELNSPSLTGLQAWRFLDSLHIPPGDFLVKTENAEFVEKWNSWIEALRKNYIEKGKGNKPHRIKNEPGFLDCIELIDAVLKRTHQNIADN